MAEVIDSENDEWIAIREAIAAISGYGLPTYGVELSEKLDWWFEATEHLEESVLKEGRGNHTVPDGTDCRVFRAFLMVGVTRMRGR